MICKKYQRFAIDEYNNIGEKGENIWCIIYIMNNYSNSQLGLVGK